MTHRPLIAALVLGLTTTGALCGDDASDTDVRVSETETPASGASETPPGGPSKPRAGAADADAAPDADAPATPAKPSSSSDEGGVAEAVGSGGLRQHSGDLATGDATLNSGEFVDSYTIDVEEGQTILVDMMSRSDLDPYIILKSPSGEQYENDDYEGDRTRSRVEQEAEEGGAWRVMATSFTPGESGAYDITIRTGAGGGGSAGGK